MDPMELQLDLKHQIQNSTLKGENSPIPNVRSKLQKLNLKCQISEYFLWQSVKFQITFFAS